EAEAARDEQEELGEQDDEPTGSMPGVGHEPKTRAEPKFRPRMAPAEKVTGESALQALLADKKKLGIIGIAAGGVLLLVVVLVIALGGKSTVPVPVSVMPSDATVTINRTKVANGTVKELAEGEYEVVAQAEGYVTAKKRFTVKKGQQTMFALNLDPEPKAVPKEEPPIAKEVPQDQPKDLPKDLPKDQAKTPDEVAQKTPDTQKTPPKENTPPAPTVFSAKFSGDDGVEISLDGKSIGKTPNAKASELKIGKSYTWTGKRAGFKPASGTVSYSGDPVVDVDVRLEREPEKVAEKQPVVSDRPKDNPKVKETPKEPVVKKTSAKAQGKLACSSQPAGAQIWVDGKNSNRVTPAALNNPLVLPVGAHTIIFKTPDGKKSPPQKVSIDEENVAKLINIRLE
ncbi:MAG: PEGA domain-containing protein, partial [Myxococcaceae bacterium]